MRHVAIDDDYEEAVRYAMSLCQRKGIRFDDDLAQIARIAAWQLSLRAESDREFKAFFRSRIRFDIFSEVRRRLKPYLVTERSRALARAHSLEALQEDLFGDTHQGPIAELALPDGDPARELPGAMAVERLLELLGPRDGAILRGILAGKTYAEIGPKVGLSGHYLDALVTKVIRPRAAELLEFVGFEGRNRNEGK